MARRRPAIIYSQDGEETACAFVRLESVGRGGAFLLCEQPVSVGSEVDLAICLAGAVIRTRARVVYHLEENGGGIGLGVEFLELAGDSAELLEQLITLDEKQAEDDVPPDRPA